MGIVEAPRLQDVARLAGVSLATASRVLRHTAPVAEETRHRVEAAIETLGYRPSSALPERRRTLSTIALIITDIMNPFFPEVVRGVEDAAAEYGLALMLCHTSEDPQREQQILADLAERHVDGVIACATRMRAEDLIAFHEHSHIPMVVVNRRVQHPEIPCIVIDFENAMYRATQHLLNLGHTNIAYLAGHPKSETSHARQRGILRALNEHGLTLPSEWCAYSFPGVEGGFQAMSSLLAQPRTQRPTAIIAYNDIMALGALHAIRSHDLRIPEDISVVGFDGIAMAAHSNPPLTTIDQPKYRIGQLALQLLLPALQGSEALKHSYLLMESPLMIRESTGPFQR